MKLYRNFNNTPFSITVCYGNCRLKYYFASKLHSEKFADKRIYNQSQVYDSLYKRYHFNIRNDILCDLYLYRKIETLGFKIENLDTGEVFRWPELVELNGGKLMQRQLEI